MIDHENIMWMKWGTPMFKGPPTDVFHHIRNLQSLKECAMYEVHYVDCMEAYGYHRGREKCRLLLEDMYECVFKIKRMRRIHLMEEERRRQFNSGERKNRYEETPPLDLF
ncbi:PREDICTED: NADH dehydrogenase [ubiquinone] iron-sulfur protein 5 [Wasmannia auropunctata]|uniref:NADH dehydrogenase [ubiquinone] iron-sulfur protein 5 n=1 Tax=Wasmannia auropunctata TaxID=64793 RepID=UPI0005EE6242|nr:PREDICTED: NADH dehydrogenase [ubiquinone] iron-sulfur protein 5 [Wasmannia auropunctata]